MSSEGHVPNPPSSKRLVTLTLAGLVVGTLLMLLFVLPAEFHIDLTGFGASTDLNRLAGAEEVQVKAPAGAAATLTHMTNVAFRTDQVDIPLESGDQPDGSEIEYKVRMAAGDGLVYSWEVLNPAPPADQFYYDFHSQSDPEPKVKVMSHKQATGLKEAGSLSAPFNGIHGWYFQNQSDKKITVRLHLAGFYRLVTPEELAAAAAGAPPAFPLEPPPDATAK